MRNPFGLKKENKAIKYRIVIFKYSVHSFFKIWYIKKLVHLKKE